MQSHADIMAEMDVGQSGVNESSWDATGDGGGQHGRVEQRGV